MNGIFDKKGQNKTPCRFFESLGVGRAVSKDTSQDRKYSETLPVKEFYLDLAVVRLERAIPEAHPFQFDTRASVRVGEQLIMVSAGQLRQNAPCQSDPTKGWPSVRVSLSSALSLARPLSSRTLPS